FPQIRAKEGALHLKSSPNTNTVYVCKKGPERRKSESRGSVKLSACDVSHSQTRKVTRSIGSPVDCNRIQASVPGFSLQGSKSRKAIVLLALLPASVRKMKQPEEDLERLSSLTPNKVPMSTSTYSAFPDNKK
ncbi:unnamed protein product, partial [Gulo gulo]